MEMGIILSRLCNILKWAVLFVVIQINYLNENNYVSASVSLRFSPASRLLFFFFHFVSSKPGVPICSFPSCRRGTVYKLIFRYCKSEHTEPASAHLGLTAGSLSSITVLRPWLISQRQAKPREAKRSAWARPFWFAPDVRLFDIFVLRMRPLCICPVSGGCLGSVSAEKMAEGTETTQQLLNYLLLVDL